MIGNWIDQLTPPSQDDALAVGGYFYVRRFIEGQGFHMSIRYFDDSDKSWWLPTNKGFEPNNSFDDWHRWQTTEDFKPITNYPRFA